MSISVDAMQQRDISLNMTHKSCYEAIDRTIRDITNIDKPMDGKPILLFGDFRPILPAVKCGTRSNIVKASFKNPSLENNSVKKTYIKSDRSFGKWQWIREIFSDLLMPIIGKGSIAPENKPDTIILPPNLGQSLSLDELRDIVHPDFATNGSNSDWFPNRYSITIKMLIA